MVRSTATQARIADAAWKIQERGAPSPRAYERLMAAWARQVRTALRRLLTEDLAADAEPEQIDEATRQRRLARFLAGLRSLRLPPPPTPAQIAVVNAPAARQGIRAARRSLLQVGLPREVMEARFQIPSGPEDMLLGIDIAPTAQDREILTRWSREGTDLIRSVGQDLVAGLDEHVVDLARSGRPLSDLAKVVQERLGVAERHAAFIARDQVAKLNSALTESTQRAAGVTRYRWRSSTDQRVRPMHHALDGSIHAWDDPPVTNENGDRNHPGEDYQCRCVAIPVLDESEQTRAPKPLRPGLTTPDEPQRTTPRRVQPARPSTPEVERADHLDAWVHGSRSKKAVAWKQAAIDELGAGGVPYSKRDYDFKPEDLAAARRSLRLQYEQTQAALRDRGVKEVRLYRGIKGEYTAAGAIESWTTDLETAKKFAGRNGKVLIETVPASRIVAHSGGPGWKNGRFGEQHEWMVLGQR